MERAATLLRLASLLLLAAAQVTADGNLSASFYDSTCPGVQATVRRGVADAVQKEARMGASLLRLFFHDCFVNGCDASVLLDDTPTFTGEKTAPPNANSLRGFDVIDAIKAQVEASCKATVSCADIVALAARDSVNLLGGPTWAVPLGRRDALTASKSAATANLPAPGSSVNTLITIFGKKGLLPRDMTALSGAHTIGQARCATFREHVYNDTNLDPTFAAQLRAVCPFAGGDGNLAPLELQRPNKFDNAYFSDLISRRGLLHSDQELYGTNGSTDGLVRAYAANVATFADDFTTAMVKMGNLPMSGNRGEVRLNCRRIN